MAKKEKPPITFQWQGKDKNGNASKGKIDAPDVATAKALLRKQGILPGKVAWSAAYTRKSLS
jgi:type IV pilus assembly protein PilC